MDQIKVKQAVPASFADAEILNKQGDKVRVGDFWKEKPTLLVFIRHFGCIGCTLQMNAIAPRLEEIHSLGIRTVVIGNGRLQWLDGFIEKFMLADKPVEVCTDPSLNVYSQASLTRNPFVSFGPKTWLDFILAWSKGIGQKSIEGDNTQLGGTLLVDSEGVARLFYKNNSVGNHSDPNEIMKAIYLYVAEKHPELY